MALEYKSLAKWLNDEDMSVEDKIAKIINGHRETVNAILDENNTLKSENQTLKADSEKLATVQTELDGAKEYKQKYDDLVSETQEKATKAAKESALRAYYESKNIKDNNLKIAMRATGLDAIELDGDKIKDTTALDELVEGEFATLVSSGQRVIDTSGSVNGGATDDKPLTLAAALHEKYDTKG